MPLVGLIDPSHVERKADEPGRLPRWYPTEELLAMATTAEPKWSPWTYELIQAALDEWQERDYISTTMLVGGCARSKVLERKEPFLLDLDSLYAALRGTQVHRTLEFTAREGAVPEGRFFTSIRVPGVKQPVEVSCSPDLVTASGDLVDYKAPTDQSGIPSYGYPWQSHVDQLEFNRYIVNHAERWDLREGDELPWDPRTLQFAHLYIVYLGPKGPKVIECQKADKVTFKNGNEGVRKHPDIWSDEYVEDLLVPRLTGMVKALAAFPRWPEELETFPGFEGPTFPDWLIEAYEANGAPDPRWKCPGKPWCKLPDCLAKRYPDGLFWEQPKEKRQRA